MRGPRTTIFPNSREHINSALKAGAAINWFELIGILVVIYWVIVGINKFFEEVDTKERESKNRLLKEKLLLQEHEKKEIELKKWREENSESLARIDENKKVVDVQKRKDYLKIQEKQNSMAELMYEFKTRRIDHQILLRKLIEIDPAKWKTVPIAAIEKIFALPAFVDKPWKSEFIDTTSYPSNRTIDNILHMFNVSEADLSSLYQAHRTKITNSGFPEKLFIENIAIARHRKWASEDELKFSDVNLHQAILSQIVIELEILKIIAAENNAVPIYSR